MHHPVRTEATGVKVVLSRAVVPILGARILVSIPWAKGVALPEVTFYESLRCISTKNFV